MPGGAGPGQPAVVALSLTVTVPALGVVRAGPWSVAAAFAERSRVFTVGAAGGHGACSGSAEELGAVGADCPGSCPSQGELSFDQLTDPGCHQLVKGDLTRGPD
jgi:hypothetical protein